MTQQTKVTQQAEAIADGWLALGPAFRTKEVLVGMIENEFASTEAADALLREARAWVFIAEHDEHCELHPDYGAQNLEASNEEAEQNALEAGGDERDVSYRTHPEDAVCTCERGDLLNRIDTHLKGANHEQG